MEHRTVSGGRAAALARLGGFALATLAGTSACLVQSTVVEVGTGGCGGTTTTGGEGGRGGAGGSGGIGGAGGEGGQGGAACGVDDFGIGAACGACLLESCCPELTACHEDAACSACLGGEGDQCAAAEDALGALVDCALLQCEEPCTAPCPTTGDGGGDEPEGTNQFAEGTDPVDCAAAG